MKGRSEMELSQNWDTAPGYVHDQADGMVESERGILEKKAILL